MTNPATNMTTEQLEQLAQSLAVTVAPNLALAVHCGNASEIARLLTPLSRQELLALAVVLASQVPQPRTRPDDGVVDDVAVRRAINGEQIPLTRTERAHAVQLMADAGAAPGTIARQLHMSKHRVEQILQQGAA